MLCCQVDIVPKQCAQQEKNVHEEIHGNPGEVVTARALYAHSLLSPKSPKKPGKMYHKMRSLSPSKRVHSRSLPTLVEEPSPQKNKIYNQVPGVDCTKSLRDFLEHLLLDECVQECKSPLTRRDGAFDYYLRSAHAKQPSYKTQLQGFLFKTDVKLEVDHTLECQLLAHILTQTEEMHPVLRAVVPAGGEQNEVVEGMICALRPLQNSSADQDFFNLRVVSRTTSLRKAQVVQGFIEGEYDLTEGPSSQVSLGDKFVELLTNDTGPLKEDHDAACRTSGVLLRELDKNHDDWVTRLGQIGGSSAQMKRYNALGETVQTVYERLERLWVGG